MKSLDSRAVLFTGYAPVHFLCFRPLYKQLLDRGTDVYVSGGLRTKIDGETGYDEKAMYTPFNIPAEQILTVPEIRQRDFSVLFAANTKMIRPRSVEFAVQLFHGISFRNRSVRKDQNAANFFFLAGPYMRRKFVECGLIEGNDPRGVPIGFLKTDQLLNGSLDREQILRRYGFDGSRPIVLYAPTGERHNSMETMGEEVIHRLSASNQFDLIIKLHDHPKNKSIDWTSRLAPLENQHTKLACDWDAIPLLFVADLLISDASSMSNEYSLLNRPMIFLDVPELLELTRRRSSSALDLDTWGRRCGSIVDRVGIIVERVSEELANPERYETIRQQMVSDLFYNPGHATEAALRWLEDLVW